MVNDSNLTRRGNAFFRLAELYNRELEEWKQACLANMETPEDRKAKYVAIDPGTQGKSVSYIVFSMVQRALELKARRERERMAIVEEKRLQHYRYVIC
jgi:hypothetical protein